MNIGATALVTEAATAAFGEAGVSAATGVMTVCHFSLVYQLNISVGSFMVVCLESFSSIRLQFCF